MMVSGYPMTLFCMLMRYSFIRYRSSSISWSCSRGMEVKKRNWTVTSTESRVAREEWKTFVGKARLSREAKLAVFKLLFRPIITYRHESWIITERMQSQVQVVETRFPEDCWIKNVGFARMNLPNSIWNTDIRESLHIEPLLMVKKQQERWFGCVLRFCRKQDATGHH